MDNLNVFILLLVMYGFHLNNGESLIGQSLVNSVIRRTPTRRGYICKNKH